MHTAYTEYEFDPAKAEANWRKHKVRFLHAMEALSDPLATTAEDVTSQGEQRFITLGCDHNGRVLYVVHTPRGNRTRLISARKASKGEAKAYHAQEN